MDIAVQVVWFVGLLIAPAYSMKYLGGARTLWAAFTVSLLLCLWIVPVTTLHALQRYHNLLTLRAVLIPALFSVHIPIYAMASWTVWKRRPSARAWAIVASLIFILDAMLPIWLGVHYSRPIRGCSVVVLVLGVTGLIVFSRRVINYDLPTIDQPTE